jgi:hypothetical protein
LDLSVEWRRLVGPLFAQFEGVYTNTATRITAAGEIVVIECRGNGKIKKLTEYMDTALAERALAPPGNIFE